MSIICSKNVHAVALYVAEVGDVVLFTPNVPVIFDGESDGEAVYTAHRTAEPMFAPK